MRGPRHDRDYPDRMIDCEAALEAEFLMLVGSAEMAGWSRQETYQAVKSLCENSALSELDNDAAVLMLEQTRRRGV